jgi:UDP-N-acetylmuramate--alanine ligase
MTDGKSFFLVGIGGSGMMPLAAILRGRGADVSGSDRGLDAGRVPAKFDYLRSLGIGLHPQDGSGVQAGQIVVASAAVEDTIADIVRATELGCRRMRRAGLLAELLNAAKLSIAVGGTSGKSTVTGMIGWILHACGRDPSVMNGAVMTNFAGPDAAFASALVGAGDAFVSEVDESDGSIALYRPAIAVLNNVSLDHKSMDELRTLFGDFLTRAQTAIVNIDNAEAAALAPAGAVTVAIDRDADLRAINIAEQPFAVTFDLLADGGVTRVSLGVPGRHNVSNALAAIAAARAAGVPLPEAAAVIAGFTGLKRRFELVGEAKGVTVIDDFGHNPDKIAATLDTLHTFPGRLLILFQPHGYGPLKVMRTELAAMLREKLGPQDVLVLPDPVYQGGTVTREVTSADLIADVGGNARHIPDRAEAAAHLTSIARPGDRIIIMGARDDTLSLLARKMLERLAG